MCSIALVRSRASAWNQIWPILSLTSILELNFESFGLVIVVENKILKVDCGFKFILCIFARLEGVSLDWNQKVNNPFSYFCYGAACAEVEIDCLTGDHQVSSN